MLSIKVEAILKGEDGSDRLERHVVMIGVFQVLAIATISYEYTVFPIRTEALEFMVACGKNIPAFKIVGVLVDALYRMKKGLIG